MRTVQLLFLLFAIESKGNHKNVPINKVTRPARRLRPVQVFGLKHFSFKKRNMLTEILTESPK